MDPHSDGVSGSYPATGAQADVGHRRVRKWLAVATTAVLAATAQVLVQVGTATPAAAVPGVFTVTSFSVYDSAHFKNVQVFCPLGSRVLGGGGLVDDGVAGPVALTWSGPYRASDSALRDHWDVSAAEPTTGFSGSWVLEGTAICGPDQPGLQMVSTRILGGGTFQAGTVACPAGTQVISVGGGTTNWPTVDAFLQLVRPDGYLTIGRLTARQGANHYPGQWYLYIDALCAYPLAGQQSAATVVNAAGGRANCPAGTSVLGLGGGGGLTDSGPYYLKELMPVTRPDGSYAAMTGTPLNGGMVIQATCTS